MYAPRIVLLPMSRSLHPTPSELCVHVLAMYKGWFNSLADVVKRRFASYVKLHLATGTTGEAPPSAAGGRRERPRGSAARLASNGGDTAKPHLRSLSANAGTGTQYGYSGAQCPSGQVRVDSGAGAFCVAESMGGGTTSKMQAPSPHVLGGGGIDRRHRSPDPPPRLVEEWKFGCKNNNQCLFVQTEQRPIAAAAASKPTRAWRPVWISNFKSKVCEYICAALSMCFM